MNLRNSQTIYSGRYTILDRLGQGGMGAVYLAADNNIGGQYVAIKQSLDRAKYAQIQFKREAETLSKLNHPNLPRITNSFEERGIQYLVMDYIDGQDLRTLLTQQKEPLDEKLVMGWLDQIMDALDYMHLWTDPQTGRRTPIIHRDIKPGNIKQASDGRIVLVDFGIAKVSTGTGTLTGARGAHTPGFSPVEQYTGTGTDIRSDIYSLGATVYSLLTRKVPPEAPDIAATTNPLLPPRTINPRLSRQVDTVVMRAMKTKPSERYQNIEAMRKGLASRWPEIRIPTPINFGGAATSDGGAFNKTTTNKRRPITSTTERGVRNPLLITAALTLLVFFAALIMLLRAPQDPIVPAEPNENQASIGLLDDATATQTSTTAVNNAGGTGGTGDTGDTGDTDERSVSSNGAASIPETSTSTPTRTDTPSESEAQSDTVFRTTEAAPEATNRASVPTSTPTPTRTNTPTRTDTPTRRVIEPSDTPTPRESTPTSTPRVPTATNTPTRTNTPTSAPVVPVVPQSIPGGTVTLLEPVEGTVRGVRTFRWQSSITLEAGQGYELVFWIPGQNPFTDGRSPVNASASTAVNVDLDRSLRDSNLNLSANRDYRWGVNLVNLDSSPGGFLRLRFLDASRLFRIEGNSSSQPTPTPRG